MGSVGYRRTARHTMIELNSSNAINSNVTMVNGVKELAVAFADTNISDMGDVAKLTNK
jgi:hypothetical protein